jgi:hypothetical protein
MAIIQMLDGLNDENRHRRTLATPADPWHNCAHDDRIAANRPRPLL